MMLVEHAFFVTPAKIMLERFFYYDKKDLKTCHKFVQVHGYTVAKKKNKYRH